MTHKANMLMNRRNVYRFYRDFASALGTTWLLVIAAAVVTNGRVGRMAALILPTQFLVSVCYAAIMAWRRRRRRRLRLSKSEMCGSRFEPI